MSAPDTQTTHTINVIFSKLLSHPHPTTFTQTKPYQTIFFENFDAFVFTLVSVHVTLNAALFKFPFKGFQGFPPSNVEGRESVCWSCSIEVFSIRCDDWMSYSTPHSSSQKDVGVSTVSAHRHSMRVAGI